MAAGLICLVLHLGPRAPGSCQLPPDLHTWPHPENSRFFVWKMRVSVARWGGGRENSVEKLGPPSRLPQACRVDVAWSCSLLASCAKSTCLSPSSVLLPGRAGGCTEAYRTTTCVSSFLCPHLLWPLRLHIGYHALILSKRYHSFYF